MLSTPRLAVFDVDGTLIDSQHNIVAAMSGAFALNGLTAPDAAVIRRIIGLSLGEAIARLLPEGREDALLPVVEAYKALFQTARMQPDHDEPMFPGAMEALDALTEQGWLLAVATGKSRRGLLAIIERHGLQGRFLSLQTADDNPGKPDPTMIRRALAESGGAAPRTVMIGDTSYDMQMGRGAGVRALGVAWGYHAPGELLAAGAEGVVSSYPDLLGSLGLLFEAVQ